MTRNTSTGQTDINLTGALNYQWAFTLIHRFYQQGVSQAVISPGSRSTPLALACEQHPQIDTWIQVDERSAGFFALGLAQKMQQPVILIATSGSAITNWFPAVVEASHSYIPLLLLSADRPAELQGCGANQTIDQRNLFGTHGRDFIALEQADEDLLQDSYLKHITVQAYKQAQTPKPGPVHVNIPFQEPLLPTHFTAGDLNAYIKRESERLFASMTAAAPVSTERQSISETQLAAVNQTLRSGRGFILCGRLTPQEQNGFMSQLVALASKLNCPVLVDPLSNLRLHELVNEQFIFNYDHFLNNHDMQRLSPDWILRFGQFPVSRKLMVFLQQCDCETLLISPYDDWLDPTHKAKTLLSTWPDTLCQQLLSSPVKAIPQDWLAQWLDMEQGAEKIIRLALESSSLFEGQVIATLLKTVPDNSFIFSGNSMIIRDFDTFITHKTAHNKHLPIYCNRGVSGIDGNLSTFFGLLVNEKKRGVAVIGDLSFYHDMNGLLMARNLAANGLDATIILINNHGGGIFNFLPQRQLDDFDKLWKTDTGLDFHYSAKLYGMDYFRITALEDLALGLTDAFSQPGIQLVEVIIDEKTSVECHNRI